MLRKVRDYTAIGDRITTLGRRQRQIADVLGVSQQTVSKKLRGETAILLSDLEKLGAHYKVPLTYFFEEEPARADLAVACEKIRHTPGPIQDLVVFLIQLTPTDVHRVLEIARVVASPDKPGSGALGASRVAEDRAAYCRK